jgi:hemerythrin-like domain-containing protein
MKTSSLPPAQDRPRHPAPGIIAPPGRAGRRDPGDALGLLDACHEKMTRQLETLERLLAHQRACSHSLATDASAAGEGQARSAAAAVLRYFDEAAPRHHDDEERDLFPALLESMAGSDAVCLRGIVDRLTAEHRQLAASWRRLRPTLAVIAAIPEASASSTGPALDAAMVAEFVQAIRGHLRTEDEELMPMARRLLSDDQVAAIGSAMAARRER